MSTRLKLLTAFARHPAEALVSGEELAQKFDLTRTGVWKHVSALRGMGFPIQSVDRSGYRFKGVADFSLANLEPSSRFIPHYALTAASTQTQAKAAALAGLPEGHVWIAEVQTSGRGRLERKWESAFGGLWFSLLLRPKVAVAVAPPLAMVAGIVLAGMLKKTCGIVTFVKRPNDVIVLQKGRRLKIAGILTEMSGESDRVAWMVMGVGLNVHNNLSPALTPGATSIAALTGKTWSRAELLKAFWKEFQPFYKRFQKDGGVRDIDAHQALLVS